MRVTSRVPETAGAAEGPAGLDPPGAEAADTAASPPLRVHYEDASVLVLDKPAGLLSVPGRGPEGMRALSVHAAQRWPDALVVHRLDMATSGLIVLARGPTAQRRLSLAFAQRAVRKRYEALVSGHLSAPSEHDDGWGLIDLPLIPDWPNRPKSRVDFEVGKPSRTRWQVRAHEWLRGQPVTRLRLEPITGRSHQLRVHLLALGHPIVGDALYAPPDLLELAPRLLLHATELDLAHPESGERLRFTSRPPF